jgi:hypothetical protein
MPLETKCKRETARSQNTPPTDDLPDSRLDLNNKDLFVLFGTVQEYDTYPPLLCDKDKICFAFQNKLQRGGREMF